MADEHAGQSLVEMLWEQADAQYAKLRALHEETGGFTVADVQAMLEDGGSDMEETSQQVTEYLQTQGKVQALCFAVGTILFPYETPKDRIAKVRPMLRERWDDNQEDEEE